jgi:hypothetical protein
VQLWVKRAHEKPLEQVFWEDASHQQTNQTSLQVQEQFLTLRQKLAHKSDLGEYGAEAIRNPLLAQSEGAQDSVPSVSTINRILKRQGVFDAKRRVRPPPPPLGWYLPEVAAQQAEIDETGFVEELAIEAGPSVFVLNLISLHEAWCASWPTLAMRPTFVQECLLSHWRQFGLSQYAQFDNGTVFHGRHCPDNIGSVTRLCLSLNVRLSLPVCASLGSSRVLRVTTIAGNRKCGNAFMSRTWRS